MKYLLDVNALVALGFAEHVFHHRVAAWLQAQHSPTLLTCSTTELGFMRVLAQAPALRIHHRAGPHFAGKDEGSRGGALRLYC